MNLSHGAPFYDPACTLALLSADIVSMYIPNAFFHMPSEPFSPYRDRWHLSCSAEASVLGFGTDQLGHSRI